MDLLLEMYAEDRQARTATTNAKMMNNGTNFYPNNTAAAPRYNGSATIKPSRNCDDQSHSQLLLLPSLSTPNVEKFERKSILTKKISDSRTYVKPSTSSFNVDDDEEKSEHEIVHVRPKVAGENLTKFIMPSRLSEPIMKSTTSITSSKSSSEF